MKKRRRNTWFNFLRRRGKKLDIRSSKARRIKNTFRWFFEGYSMDGVEELKPRIDIPIYKFDIHDIEFREFKDRITMKIKLGRPGLLIGKQGRTIDALAEYLNDKVEKKIEIKIEDSYLWA